MTATLISNIGELVTNSDKELGIIKDAALVVENKKVIWVGENKKAPSADKAIDAKNGTVTPGFVDSHTHAIFAGDRSKDYEARMSGTSYSAGGINTTVAATRSASDEELRISARKIVDGARKSGTTTIEIKSGYGLYPDAELKILRVIKELKKHTPLTIKSTFLAAHAIPMEFKQKRKEYIDIILNETLPKVAEEKLADYIDIFCERNYFSVEEMEEILTAGKKYGLTPKVHVNQFSVMGGIAKAIELGALSVDHLENFPMKISMQLSIQNVCLRCCQVVRILSIYRLVMHAN